MTRVIFRAFWRAAYRNPEYLKYSGGWDSRIVNGGPVKAEWYHLGHWVDSFRNEVFLYRNRRFEQ